MHRERGAGGSKVEVDRKRINDALDKQLERSSPSTSRVLNGKDKGAHAVIMGKQPSDHRDSRSAASSLTKANASDGIPISLSFISTDMALRSLGFLFTLKKIL